MSSIKSSSFIQTIVDRGFVHSCTNLLDATSVDRIIGYIGFDLTADSLHVGSLIQLMILRRMAESGHRPIALIGEATTKIGDPSGKSEQRPILDDLTIRSNKAGIKACIQRLVPDVEFISNGEWFDNIEFFEFLRRYGNHFTINRMLTLDSVKSRLDRQSPMTFFEFNYMLLQAVDFLELNNLLGCTFQFGGSDQWGNIVNGVDLIRRVNGNQAFGVTTHLLTNKAGKKMGKTVDGAIWLDETKTSTHEFWQFWRNVEDEKVNQFLKLFTSLDLPEIDIICRDDLNAAKVLLADNVTEMVHGPKALSRNPLHILRRGATIADALLQAKMVSSKGDAARLAANNGISLNGKKISAVGDVLDGTDEIELSVGKNKKATFRVEI